MESGARGVMVVKKNRLIREKTMQNKAFYRRGSARHAFSNQKHFRKISM
jgi:hypothetical protein